MLTNYENKSLTTKDLQPLEKRRTQLVIEEQRIVTELQDAVRSASELQARIAEGERACAVDTLDMDAVMALRDDHARGVLLVQALESKLAAHRGVLRCSNTLISEAKSSRDEELSARIAKADFEEDGQLADKLRIERRALRGGPKPPESIDPSNVKITDTRGGKNEVIYDPAAPKVAPMYGGSRLVKPKIGMWDR